MFHIGVVESNEDPKKLGRLKVRIFGIHSENRQQIDNTFQFLSTEDLPWCYPANPISNSSIDGISDFSTLVNGTRVFVFFVDKHKQVPFYFATMNSILEQMPNFDVGFSDPNQEHPEEDFVGESSISRLARNEKIDETCVQIKNDNKTTWAHDEEEIEEPESAYAAEYPYNRVIETPSGIIIELDSTPNAERIHIYHPNNSYIEMDKDGNKVSKIQGKDYEIILNDKNLYVAGDLKITADGKLSIFSKGETKIKAENNTTINSGGKTIITSEGDVELKNDSGKIDIKAGGTINVDATGNVNIKGQLVNLN